MNKNDEYRANAAECQRMARFTRNESEKRTWLEMAESWLRLIQPTQPSDTADRLADRFDAIAVCRIDSRRFRGARRFSLTTGRRLAA